MCVSESLRSYLKLITHNRQDLKAQLSQERDAVRHVTLQKDIDLKDLQTRLDRMVSTTSVKITLSTYALQTGQLSQARESLVGAETSKAHLQERVDQLTRQLQGNEKKLAVYERRTAGIDGAAPAVEQDLPREQQLKQEVAELRLVSKDCLWCSTKQIDVRSAPKVAQVDLAAARSRMQQFQEISQANEAALSALNATHDRYKTETEAQLTKNEVG